MYTKRTPKSQLPDKTPYTVHYPHTRGPENRRWDQGYHRVVSIDPGEVHFCIRIEKRPDVGVITPELYTKVCLSDMATNPETGLCQTYTTLTTFLDQYVDLFETSHMIIIERQLPINYKMVRLSQHVVSYFCMKLKDAPLLPLITEVAPTLKSQQLGAPKGLSPKEVKLWTIDKAIELLGYRNDHESIRTIKDAPKSKMDDFADVVAQIEALFSLLGMKLTEVPLRLNIIPKIPQITPYKMVLVPSNSYNNGGSQLQISQTVHSHITGRNAQEPIPGSGLKTQELLGNNGVRSPNVSAMSLQDILRSGGHTETPSNIALKIVESNSLNQSAGAAAVQDIAPTPSPGGEFINGINCLGMVPFSMLNTPSERTHGLRRSTSSAGLSTSSADSKAEADLTKWFDSDDESDDESEDESDGSEDECEDDTFEQWTGRDAVSFNLTGDPQKLLQTIPNLPTSTCASNTENVINPIPSDRISTQ